MKPEFYLRLLILLPWLFSCTAKKFIPEDRQLYTGAEVVLDSTSEISEAKKLRKEIEAQLGPAPNFSIFGISRPTLWLYYQVKDTSRSGVSGWLKYTLGTPPVYLSDVPVRGNTRQVAEFLENKGFFEATVDATVTDSGKTTDVRYTVDIHPAYLMNRVTYLPTSRQADTVIRRHFRSAESLVLEGCPYSLETLRNERVRINDTLRNNGYFYFNPDYLIYRLDTAETGRNTDLYLSVKREAPDKAMIPYRLKDVVIHLGYDLTQDTLSVKYDTVLVEGYKVLFYDSTFRAKPVIRALMLRPGEFFSRYNRERTLSRLISMGAFRYVNIEFKEADTSGVEGRLVAHVYLSPMLQHTIRTELKMVTKSNNFTGPAIDLSYHNRNLLRGAELLMLSTALGYEAQFARSSNGLNSYEVGLQGDLFIPHSISVFKGDKHRGPTMPRTHFGLGGRILSRINFFKMYAFNGRYGYNWSPRKFVTEEFAPLTVSYVNVHEKSAQFDEILAGNPVLQRSFEKQFIIGPEFHITYNNQPDRNRNVNLFVRFSAGESGVLTGAVGGSVGSVPVSQFLRADVDFRQYFNFTAQSRLVTRIFIGTGYPYGNSFIMPYMKQYFAGGANSIRAFPARTVGPGSYAPADSVFTILFLDQSGDIKLEGNIEYRFPLSRMLRGAIFLDAGNVWLMNPDPARPGGVFTSNFLGELAAGYGFGLRIDLTYFVLRFDLARPLLRPYADSETPLPHEPSGLLGDAVLNIAIGYPF